MESGPASVASVLTADRVSCSNASVQLHDVTLTFPRGSFNVFVGPVGAGKKLLVQVLGLLHTPEHGDVLLEGEPTRALSDEARGHLRNLRFGYIFTAPFLLSSFTVLENVAMPLFRVGQMNPEQAQPRCAELLKFVGLADVAQQPVGDLPMSVQHAVSLARGLANEPVLLMVEDVTGDLPAEEACQFTSLLRQTCSVFGTTVIGASSSGFIATGDDRCIELSSGVVHRDSWIESART